MSLLLSARFLLLRIARRARLDLDLVRQNNPNMAAAFQDAAAAATGARHHSLHRRSFTDGRFFHDQAIHAQVRVVLRVSDGALERLRDQALRLSEAILHLLKTSPGGDAQARMEVETQLRSANELIAQEQKPEETATLMDGSVISVKEEWSLVVGNLGEKQGVKMGMPLRVMRGDKLIATLRVVDVRQKICGAVIQEMGSEKEKIRVGDRLQADARKNVSLK